MKVRNFLLSGLFVAALGFVAVGCNENPIDNPGTGTTPNPARNLSAVSLAETSVGLKWDAPTADTVTGAITYMVHWSQAGNAAADSGTVNNIGVTQASMTVQAQKAYDFTVYAVRGGKTSTAATITWAGATRYGGTSQIRIYEDESIKGSGLVLDPALGGPLNVSVSAANNPSLGNVQLAIYTQDSDPDHFIIGPAFAFTEYANADQFNQTTFISDSAFATPSLDGWYLTTSVDNWFKKTNGNVSAFTLPAVQSNNGQVFFVRTGATGNYHYARILVKNNGGKLLQGTGTEQYVELEISYQKGANVAYAKTAPGNAPSANMGSQARR